MANDLDLQQDARWLSAEDILRLCYRGDLNATQSVLVGVSNVTVDNATIDVNDAGIGDPSDALVIDTTLSASVIALLKGALEQLQPSSDFEVVTTSDVTNLRKTTRAIRCSATGAVSVQRASDNTTVVIPSVQAGELLVIAVTRVNTTDTTVSAGSLVAYY